MASKLLRIVLLVVTLCHFASALRRDAAFVPAVKSVRSSALFGSRKPKETELLDVAIIGGGPTGLVCALSLLRASLSSPPSKETPSMAIFESDSFMPKGASVVLQTNGWKAIKCIDKETYQEMRADSAPTSYIAYKNFSGKPLVPVPLTIMLRFLVRPLLRLFRTGMRSTSWHAVRSSFKNGVERLGSKLGYSTNNLIRSKTSLVSVDPACREDGRVLLKFSDGTEVAASTVLACDGTFSTVRKSLAKYEEKVAASNKMNQPVILDEELTAWRGMIPSIERNGTATFFSAQKEANIIGATATLFPASGTVGGSSLAIMAPTKVTGRAKDTEDARKRLKKFLKSLKVPIDQELLEAINEANVILEHRIFCRDAEANPDISSGYDRIAYVGDAAHALRPTGESISLAMEDAWTIGNLVVDSKKGTLSPDLLRSYEQTRQGRVNAVSRAVRLAAQSWYVTQSDDEKEEEDTEANKRRLQQTGGIKQVKKEHPIVIRPLY